MPRRKIGFANGEYYHIFNRGVDKREIFNEEKDVLRFIQSVLEFNNIENIGSIYENSLRKKTINEKLQINHGHLVTFIAYCINPNHYHFIVQQNVDNGISKFMHKLSLGYSMYFNEKYKRSGPLFSGCFKAKHIDSNEYLIHLSAYVNLNNLVHQIKFGDRVSKFVRSSWGLYSNTGTDHPIPCETKIILEQFNNNPDEYKKYGEGTLQDIIERKRPDKDMAENSQGLF